MNYLIIKHKIKMEMTRKEPAPYIEVIQHEKKSRILELSLEENGIPVSLPETCKVVVRYQKRGRRYRAYDTLKTGEDAWYIRDNTVGVLILPDVCDTDGITDLMLELVDENEILYTFPVEVRVKGNDAVRAKVSEGGHFAGFLPQAEGAKEGEYLYVAEVDHRGRVIRTESKILETAQGGIHVGPLEPQNENVNLWVDTIENVPEPPAGKNGKSAYEYAKEGGYTGTESEFAAKLAEEYPQPDWSAVEGQRGHVLNRTHYSEWVDTVLIDNQTFASTDEMVLDFALVEGQSYHIVWNGAEFDEVARSADVGGQTAVMLGNSTFMGGEDTGEPYAILYMDGLGTMPMDISGAESATVTLSTFAEVAHKLPEKYLPETGPFYFIILGSLVGGDNIFTAMITVSKLEEVFASGRQIIAKFQYDSLPETYMLYLIGYSEADDEITPYGTAFGFQGGDFKFSLTPTENGDYTTTKL